MMDSLRIKLVIVVVAIQMIFFASWYAIEADAFGKPIAQIKVKTEPYDPRDLLSGQYTRMNYTFSRVRRWSSEEKRQITEDWAADITYRRKGETVWVVMHKKDGFYVAKHASFSKLTLGVGEVLIKGRYDHYSRISYGIEKYFVPEGTRDPERDDEVTVLLDVYDSGKVRINQVYVNDVVWP